MGLKAARFTAAFGHVCTLRPRCCGGVDPIALSGLQCQHPDTRCHSQRSYATRVLLAFCFLRAKAMPRVTTQQMHLLWFHCPLHQWPCLHQVGGWLSRCTNCFRDGRYDVVLGIAEVVMYRPPAQRSPTLSMPPASIDTSPQCRKPSC